MATLHYMLRKNLNQTTVHVLVQLVVLRALRRKPRLQAGNLHAVRSGEHCQQHLDKLKEWPVAQQADQCDTVGSCQ